MYADPESLREFATRYTAAWCGGDPAAVADFYAPGGSLTINGAAPAVGRSAIADAARSFMIAFPDLRVSMDDLRIRGERVEYHWTLLGSNTGPGGTGNRVRISGFELWQFDADGRISVSLGNFDEAGYECQLNRGTEHSVAER
jgi:uncharacterized protein (TIGR02246 family)